MTDKHHHARDFGSFARFPIQIVLPVLLALCPSLGWAAPTAVRFAETATHAFLTLKNDHGEVLAYGELVQAPRQNTVESRMIFRFKDGSLYDEIVTFSQRNVFRLISYRLVQHGKSFPAPSETFFDRYTGRYQARSGTANEKSTEGTLDLPEDVHNGITGILLKNLPSGAHATGHLLAFTPKPRVLKSELRAEGGDKYFVGDMAYTATRYLIKLEIGGLAGMVAGWLGKVPPEVRYWITTGPAPAFVKFEGAMFLNGPRWRIELSVPRWSADQKPPAAPSGTRRSGY
jgi:hypothetical protein